MLEKFRLYFKYLLTFRNPLIIKFDYIDYLIVNKGYFLVSWKSNYAYKLTIKPLYSTFYKGGGSIYIAVPDDIEILEIEISNLWRSRIFKIKLRRTQISIPFEFNLLPEFKQLDSSKIYLPKLNTSAKILLLNIPQAYFSKSSISTKSISFHKKQT